MTRERPGRLRAPRWSRPHPSRDPLVASSVVPEDGEPPTDASPDLPQTTSPAADSSSESDDLVPAGALRVAIIDDDPRIRTLAKLLLDRSDVARIVAEASDGSDALQVVRQSQPDVVLLDLLMPKVDGRTVLPTLVREAPRTMVLVLSALSGLDEADHSFALGAFAYLEKSVVGPGLATEIRNLHELFQRALSGETVWRPAGPARIRR